MVDICFIGLLVFTRQYAPVLPAYVVCYVDHMTLNTIRTTVTILCVDD